METNIEDIASSICDLSIADNASQNCGHKTLRPTRSLSTCLQDAIPTLIQSTTAVTSHVEAVKSLTHDAKVSNGLPIADMLSLHQGTRNLADLTSNLQSTVDALNEAIERSIVTHIKSYAGYDSSIVHKMLSHFERQIKEIVREVVPHASSGDLLWKIAEKCFHQATDSCGNLDADSYFVPLEEACLEWPYDPDFESEEYYEHESRLEVDEGYATAFQERTQRRHEAREKEKQMWPNFWIRVLNDCPAGPTLFYPPTSLITRASNLDAIPQYLFRIFDGSSSGKNDEKVIASVASCSGTHESSRIDMLRLEKRRATVLLHMHLTKSCFTGDESDNLMSWTSSLLFAVQYAVWRLRRLGCRPADIKICTVDTKKFPPGQFTHDTWLLDVYRATANQLGNLIEKFFKLRRENKNYYNGEFLSQGAVNHEGRSCVISLEQLIQAGLYQLYPEFEDAEANRQWAKRALQLRQKWSVEQATTDQEIQVAFTIARKCFTRFDPADVASILLTFKNRRYSEPQPQCQSYIRPKWADCPEEVRRYWTALDAIKSVKKFPHGRISILLLQQEWTLRQIFD